MAQPPHGAEVQSAFQTIEEILMHMREDAYKIDISWPMSLRDGVHGGVGSSLQLQQLMLRLSLHTAGWLQRKLSPLEQRAVANPLIRAKVGENDVLRLELRLSYFPVELLLAVVEGIRFALNSISALPICYGSLFWKINEWQDDDPEQETSKVFLRELAHFASCRTTTPTLRVHGSLDLPALLPASGCLAVSVDRLALNLAKRAGWNFSLSGIHTLTSYDVWGDASPVCIPTLWGVAGLRKDVSEGNFEYFLATEKHAKDFAGIVQRGARSSSGFADTGLVLHWTIDKYLHGRYEGIEHVPEGGIATLCSFVEQLSRELDGVPVDIEVKLPPAVRQSAVEAATRPAAALTSGLWWLRSLTVEAENPMIVMAEGHSPYWHVFAEQLPLGSLSPASLEFRFYDESEEPDGYRDEPAQCIPELVDRWLRSNMTLQECKLVFYTFFEDDMQSDEVSLAKHFEHLYPRFERNRKLPFSARTLLQLGRCTTSALLKAVVASQHGPEAFAFKLLQFLYPIDDPIAKQVRTLCGLMQQWQAEDMQPQQQSQGNTTSSAACASSPIPAAENESSEEAASTAKSEDDTLVQDDVQLAIEESSRSAGLQTPSMFNADLMRALQQSRLEQPPGRVARGPLWLDEDQQSVRLELDRCGEQVRAKIHESILTCPPELELQMSRVLAAGCELQPEWADGSLLLVPCTQEMFLEAGPHPREGKHYVYALRGDQPALEALLRRIFPSRKSGSRKRPQLRSPSDTTAAAGTVAAPTGCRADGDATGAEEDPVILVRTFQLGTFLHQVECSNTIEVAAGSQSAPGDWQPQRESL